jgi:hypothetical protein
MKCPNCGYDPDEDVEKKREECREIFYWADKYASEGLDPITACEKAKERITKGEL